MSGSVSCRRETAGAGTSNASTTIRAEVACGFIWPVNWIVNVWLASVRPFTVNIGTRISSVLEYVSTSPTKTPSTNTRATPAAEPRPPLQLTEGPLTLKPACAPAVAEAAADAPLHALLASALQPALELNEQ